MPISAHVQNAAGKHQVSVSTNGHTTTLSIAPKSSGLGSSVNGGELLCLALATCYCNDLYREAAKRDIRVEQVDVEVISEFGAEGEPARSITYLARVAAHASADAIRDLVQHTDHVAEIQNTVRSGLRVTLEAVDATSV